MVQNLTMAQNNPTQQSGLGLPSTFRTASGLTWQIPQQGAQFPAFPEPRKLTKEELELIKSQKGVTEVMKSTMEEQLANAKFYNNYIRNITPTTPEDVQAMRNLNRNQLNLTQSQIGLQKSLINSVYETYPKYREAALNQLELFNENMKLVSLQNETATVTEPARKQLLLNQIEQQIKAVSANASTVALQQEITGLNAGPVLEFAKQNLTYQKVIDQNQFGNILTSQQIESRQLDIFQNQLPQVAAFQDRQLEVAGRAQGLSEEQIDFSLQKLGLERFKLGVESSQVGTSAGLYGQQAGALSAEIAGGKSAFEQELSGLGVMQAQNLSSAIQGNVPVSLALKNKQQAIIKEFVESSQRRGLNVTGTTLEDLQGVGSTSAENQVAQLKKVLLEQEDTERRNLINQYQAGLGSTGNLLNQVKEQRVGLSTIGVGTQKVNAQNVATPNIAAANVALPASVNPNVKGLSTVNFQNAPGTNIPGTTYTTGQVAGTVVNPKNPYAGTLQTAFN